VETVENFLLSDVDACHARFPLTWWPTLATLLNYLKLYNHHIPQRAIGSKTPVLALKEWQQKRPELFVKRVYDQTGLDR